MLVLGIRLQLGFGLRIGTGIWTVIETGLRLG